MLIQSAWVALLASALRMASSGGQRHDNFIAQDDQSTHGSQALGHHLVAASGGQLAHEVFGAEFLQRS